MNSNIKKDDKLNKESQTNKKEDIKDDLLDHDSSGSSKTQKNLSGSSKISKSKQESKEGTDIEFYELDFEGSCFEKSNYDKLLKLESFIDSKIKESLGETNYNLFFSNSQRKTKTKKVKVKALKNTDKKQDAPAGASAMSLLKTISKPFIKYETQIKSEANSLFGSKLKILHEDASSYKTVVFVQNKAINEYESQNRLDEVLEGTRADEFYHFFKLEHIISKLSVSSNIRWVYVINEDLVGPFFSFAMSCDRVLSFNPKARIGFMAKESGMLPCLGGRIEKEGVIHSIIENFEPSFSTYFAFKKDIINYCGSYSNWKKNLKYFLDQEEYVTRSNIYLTPKEVKLFDNNLDKKFLKFCSMYKIKNVFDEEQMSSYSFYETNIKPRFKNFSYAMRLALRAYLNSRQVYSFGYKSFLDEQIGFKKYIQENKTTYGFDRFKMPQQDPRVNDYEILQSGRLKEDVREEPFNKKVYIDFNHILPPLDPILNLIRSGFNVVFFASSSKVLFSLMDLFYLRLSNQELDLEISKSQVLSHIHWFVGNLINNDGFLLKWISNEEISLSYKDEPSYSFNSIYKKDSVYLPNWFEYEVNDFSKCIDAKINYVITTMIKPPIFTRRVDGLSLSTYVRSWFLEKLIRFSVQSDLDVMDILEVLEEFGWGISASDICWDKFMIARQEKFLTTHIDVYQHKIGIDDNILDPEILSMNVWKEVYIYSPKISSKQKISTVAINMHFVNCARFIKNLIFEKGYTQSSYLAAVLVRECLGITESSRYYLKKSGMYLE